MLLVECLVGQQTVVPPGVQPQAETLVAEAEVEVEAGTGLEAVLVLDAAVTQSVVLVLHWHQAVQRPLLGDFLRVERGSWVDSGPGWG